MANNPPPSSGAQFRPMVPGQQGQHFVPGIHGEISSADTHCVFTNLDSCFALSVHKDEIISDFKEKLLKQHKQVFPQIGEIIISALKVKLRGKFYHLSDSMNVYKAFDGSFKKWFMYVDVVKVEEGELLAAGDKRSNLELVKEFTIGSKLEDGHTKDLILEGSLETEVVEKKSRKRKIKSSDGKTSRKKSKVDLNQSNVDTTNLCGEILVDGHNMDVVKDGPDNNTVKEALEKLDDLTGTEEPELEKGRKSASIVVIDQEKDLPPASELADGQIASHDEERVTLRNPFVEAIQKETEVGMNYVDGVGRANTETTDNLVSYPENLVEANSALTTSPVTEKKKKRKRSSKDHIYQSATAVTSTTASTPELCPIIKRGNLGIENEMGKKITEDVESRKAIPSSSDNTHTDNLVSYPQNQLVCQLVCGLTTGPTTEKKKKQKKSTKDQLTTATTTSKKLVNERKDATSDTLVYAIQNENAMGEQRVCKVGSREDTVLDANNPQVAGLASTCTLTALIQESQMLDQTGISMDENPSCEHDVSKENVERDADEADEADEAKSLKSTKKKSSRKAKTRAKENILVDSGSQNVELIEVEDIDGPDNIIRNVLDSLQQKEAEENLDKRSKKSSKRLKKKNSLNIVDEAHTLQQKNKAEENLEKNVKKSSKRSEKKNSLDIVEEAQILSVEVTTAAQKEASPINNSKDTDTPFTPSKKNTDDITLSMQNLRENADMGNNFGSGQKDTIVGGEKEDEVTGGAKTEKEKKSLDLHPSGSIDGSIKLKDRKGRVQPSSSGTSHLQSKAMDDYNGSKVDQFDASVKGAVNNKKETVKKSSNLATLKKSKMNDNKKKETVKEISNLVTSNKRKTNFFKDVEKWNSPEDESKTTSHVSTKRPSDSSSEDDSDVTSMSRKQGNNLVGGTNRISGSLLEILRSSKL